MDEMTVRARGPRGEEDFLGGNIATDNLPDATDLGPRLQEESSSSTSASDAPGGTNGTDLGACTCSPGHGG